MSICGIVKIVNEFSIHHSDQNVSDVVTGPYFIEQELSFVFIPCRRRSDILFSMSIRPFGPSFHLSRQSGAITE